MPSSATGAPPKEKNIRIIPGRNFRLDIMVLQNGVAADLAGASAKMQVRDKRGGALLLDLDAATTVTLPNTVTVNATGAETTGLAQNGVYDVQLTYQDTSVDTPVEGKVEMTARIST